jgi:hypothetical protein
VARQANLAYSVRAMDICSESVVMRYSVARRFQMKSQQLREVQYADGFGSRHSVLHRKPEQIHHHLKWKANKFLLYAGCTVGISCRDAIADLFSDTKKLCELVKGSVI